MNGFDVEFHRLLVRELGSRMDERAAQLAQGTAKDHADYLGRCAHIKAFKEVLELCDEISRRIAKE